MQWVRGPFSHSLPTWIWSVFSQPWLGDGKWRGERIGISMLHLKCNKRIFLLQAARSSSRQCIWVVAFHRVGGDLRGRLQKLQNYLCSLPPSHSLTLKMTPQNHRLTYIFSWNSWPVKPLKLKLKIGSSSKRRIEALVTKPSYKCSPLTKGTQKLTQLCPLSSSLFVTTLPARDTNPYLKSSQTLGSSIEGRQGGKGIYSQTIS